MHKRDEYVDKMKDQLDEWNAGISRMQEKADQAAGAAKQQYAENLNQLKKHRDACAVKLSEVQAASDDIWEETKKGAEGVWSVMKETFRNMHDIVKS